MFCFERKDHEFVKSVQIQLKHFFSNREGTFVRKGTFRVKKGNNAVENKENIPQIHVDSEGKGDHVFLLFSHAFYICIQKSDLRF